MEWTPSMVDQWNAAARAKRTPEENERLATMLDALRKCPLT